MTVLAATEHILGKSVGDLYFVVALDLIHIASAVLYYFEGLSSARVGLLLSSTACLVLPVDRLPDRLDILNK
jgi:hypothetical protein